MQYTINATLNILKAYLDAYKKNDIDIELSAINKEGNPDKDILITLVHVEEDTSLKRQIPSFAFVNGKETNDRYANPELALNLYVLISAHNDKYETALNNISYVIGSFQRRNVFNFEDYLDNEVKFTDFDDKKPYFRVWLHSLTMEQDINLWQSIGYKMMPSVMYKVSMIHVQEEVAEEKSVPRIKKVIQKYSKQIVGDARIDVESHFYEFRLEITKDLSLEGSDKCLTAINAVALFAMPKDEELKTKILNGIKDFCIKDYDPKMCGVNGTYDFSVEEKRTI